MATIDMTHRKLDFPPRFLPYLEKHRIFELFHELIELLVQVKPKDHIQFLKRVLPCAAIKKDKQRIVFLTPSWFDRVYFTEHLADCLGIQCINRNLLKMMTRDRKQGEKTGIQVICDRVEEESCICPGEMEAEGETYPLQIFFPPMSGEESAPENLYEESEKTSEPLSPEEEPCVCVCPCVKKEQEGEGNKEEEEEKKEEEKKGEEGEEDDYPCEPRKPKKICESEKSKDGLTSYQGSYPFEIKSSESIESEEVDVGILTECEESAKGWILQDFPLTGEEAEMLNAAGAIPTHAFRIIIDEKLEESNLEYKANVKEWMKAYKYVPVLEIRMKNRSMHELVKDMCELLSVMPHRHAPMLPRIVLIGSRGAGVTTQAQKLAQKYGMVHVEYDLVISRALQQDDELCKLYKIQLATRPDPELEAVLLERALMSSKCRNHGWVLTGYPRNSDQMRMLDIIATPPNRVIFIEVPPRECFVRLYYRKTDPCLGDEYKIPEVEPFGLYSTKTPNLDPKIAARLLSHPRNDKKQVVHDIEQYFLHKEEMMSYYGKTASIVDGNQEIERVFELIEQILINPSPAQPPRDPLSLNYGIDESYERLKKFRLQPGMFFNNMVLNPPERSLKQ